MVNYDPNPEASETPRPLSNQEIKQFTELGFVCEAHGYMIPCFGYKTGAHVITRKLVGFKNDTLNIITICKAHETYFNTRPLQEWYRWVKIHFPQHYGHAKHAVEFVLEQLLPFIEVMEGGDKKMSDTYRKEYKPLTDNQKVEMQQAKEAAEGLEAVLNKAIGNGADARLIATAKTYLEISILLAVKGITAERAGATAPQEDRGATPNPAAEPAAPATDDSAQPGGQPTEGQPGQ